MDQSVFGSVEAHVTNGGYAGDMVLDETSDLVLAVDTPGPNNDIATQERIARLMFTPSIELGGDPGDIFHPDWGLGLPDLVDALWTPALATELEAQTLSGLESDPGVSDDPPPAVTVTRDGNTVYLSAAYTNASGDQTTLPDTPLTSTGS